MNQIEFRNVWKKFKKGEKFSSLRDAIPHLFKKTFSFNNDYELRQEEFWALEEVNFEIKKGEVVGIIGPNGAGKSTILKLLSRILVPNKGKIEISGRLSALIEVTSGFHPELTGRENVYLNGTILGMNKREIDSKFDQIVDFSGIVEFIDTPVKRYSSGMYSRLGFSVAAHMDPDILLVDEVLSVGDIAFQAKCAQKMRELLKINTTIVLVSHNLSLIQSLCKRAILLNKGEILKEGHPEEIISYYQNIISNENEEEFKKNISSNYKVSVDKEPKIKIFNVSLLDGNNEQKETFNIGESISIKFEYETKESIENPVFYLGIERSDGVLCCISDTKGDESLMGDIQGKGRIKIDLGNLNLATGIYVAKISIWDKDMIHSYVTRSKDIFKIQSKEVTTNNAIFFPKAKWKLD